MNILIFIIPLLAECFGRQGFGPGEQDWGYVTVRAEAHMFWWLYETTDNVSNIAERPLLIWLQGGPGASSTGIGNFQQLGPLDLDLNRRDHTWVKEANVLFIDNPVGSGYSYVGNLSALTTTNKQIAEDLIKCLSGFYDKRPEFRNAPLYIGSQSYGGKMATEFAYELYKASKAGTIEANLKGLSLVSSAISTLHCLSNWAPVLFNFGAIDREGYEIIKQDAENVNEIFSAGFFTLAMKKLIDLGTVVMDLSKNIDLYNLINKVSSHIAYKAEIPYKSQEENEKLYELMNGPVKNALNLNITWGAQKDMVFNAHIEDYLKPVTHIIEQLLNETTVKVQVISGQLDLMVNIPATVQWVDELQWSGSDLWKSVPRNALSVNGINEGYQKTLGQLSLFWVNRAGHMIPIDNPAAMGSIFTNFIKD